MEVGMTDYNNFFYSYTTYSWDYELKNTNDLYKMMVGFLEYYDRIVKDKDNYRIEKTNKWVALNNITWKK